MPETNAQNTDILTQHKRIFVFCFGIMFLTYFAMIANFTPTADSEWLPGELVGPTLRQGRILSSLLLGFMAPTTSIHPFDILIALAAFAVSGAVAIFLWLPGPARLEHYVAGAVVATFPTTVHMYTFSAINAFCGLALMASSFAVLFLARGRYALFCALVIAVLSLYQGAILHTVVVFLFFMCGRILLQQYDAKTVLKKCAILLLLLIASAIVYYLIVSGIHQFVGKKLGGAVGQLKPGALLDDFGRLMGISLNFLYEIFTGKDQLINASGSFLGAVHIIFLSAFVVTCIRRCDHWVNALFAILLGLCAASLPFLSVALTGGSVRYRFLLAAPFAFSGIFLFATLHLNRNAQMIMAAIGMVAAFFYAQSTAEMILRSQLSWQADRELSSRIIERISLLRADDAPEPEKTPFDMVGRYAPDTPWIPLEGRTSLGVSYFFYGENVGRPVRMFSMLGYDDFTMIDNGTRLKILGRISKMPIWPKSGSVALIEGVAVVKFSEKYTNHQISKFCAGMPAKDCRDVYRGM